MTPNTMTELYVDELKDLYSAENQILKALPKMIKAATHTELKDAFEDHRRQTETHVARLETILGEAWRDSKWQEVPRHGSGAESGKGLDLIEEDPEAAVLDAGLIAAAQHVEHYEMARYGSARIWPIDGGRTGQAKVLQHYR